MTVRRVLLCSVMSVLPTLACAAPAPSAGVRWLTMDYPPVFILDGPRKGQGIGDVATRLAIAALPDYATRLEPLPVNYVRIEREIQSHPDLCFSAFVKTPDRERYMVFSEPYVLFMPPRLLLPAGQVPPGGADEPVDLEALLGSGFHLGVLGGRRFGAGVDAALERYADQDNLYRRFSRDQLSGLFDMLARHERGLDGVLAFPNEITYYSQSHRNAPALESFPIKGAPPFLRGRFGCANSPEGKALIAALNQRLGPIREQARGAYMALMDPRYHAEYLLYWHAEFDPIEPAR